MKRLSIIILLSFLLGACDDQTKSIELSDNTEVKLQAESMAQLLLKSDFKSFSKFTHPKVIEMMGGEEKMIETLESGTKAMAAEGTGFLSISIGEPSKIISINNELQCTLSQTIEMKVPNGKLTAKSTLIAISTNNGKSWYFIDTSGKNIETMQKLLPNLSSDLVISANEKPVFSKD